MFAIMIFFTSAKVYNNNYVTGHSINRLNKFNRYFFVSYLQYIFYSKARIIRTNSSNHNKVISEVVQANVEVVLKLLM